MQFRGSKPFGAALYPTDDKSSFRRRTATPAFRADGCNARLHATTRVLLTTAVLHLSAPAGHTLRRGAGRVAPVPVARPRQHDLSRPACGGGDQGQVRRPALPALPRQQNVRRDGQGQRRRTVQKQTLLYGGVPVGAGVSEVTTVRPSRRPWPSLRPPRPSGPPRPWPASAPSLTAPNTRARGGLNRPGASWLTWSRRSCGRLPASGTSAKRCWRSTPTCCR